MDNNIKLSAMNKGIVSLVVCAIEDKKEMHSKNKTFDREFGGVNFDKLACEMLNDKYLLDGIKDIIDNSYKLNIEKQYYKTGEDIWKPNANI